MKEEEKDILTNLHKNDIAACEVYKDVIAAIDNANTKKKLTEFLNDHERHVLELSRLIEEITHKKPSEWRDVKGMLLSGYSTVMSMAGEKNALKALQMAEKMILELYQNASLNALSPKAMSLIKKNLEDEEKHSKYVNERLDSM